MIKKAILLGIIMKSFSMNSQTIVSQDFEGPLVGWPTNATVTSTQNSVTPVSGSAMLSLGASSYIHSPNFSLPTGAKHVSFWLNSYLTGYDITVKLYQNNLPVLTLGTFQNSNTQWSLKNINIPGSYSGSDYTILFEVVPNAVGALRYYLDDIKVEVGQAPTSIKEINNLTDVSVIQQPGLENRIIIKANSTVSGINLSLFDVKGKMVFSLNDFEINSNEQIVDLPNQGEGIYILNIEKNNKKYVKKMILH